MTSARRHVLKGLAASAFVGAAPLNLAWAQAAEPVTAALDEGEDDDTHSRVETGQDAVFRMLAPVSINGHGPYNFLVDTGANRSCISRDLAQQLALPKGPDVAVTTIVGRRIHPTVMIDQLHVGARAQKRVAVPTLKLAEPDGTDGILGVDWLKRRRLVLDFEAGVLEIAAPRSESSGHNRVVIPARRRSGQLTLIDAESGGKRISAMIDSGSQMTLGNDAMRRLVVASRTPGIDPGIRITMKTVIGETFHGDLLYVPFMRLGGLNLGYVPVVFADSHVFRLWGLDRTPSVVLGMDLLREFSAVALDFGRSTVRFDVA